MAAALLLVSAQWRKDRAPARRAAAFWSASMSRFGSLSARPRRHAPLLGRSRPARPHARGAFPPLVRPARRAGERTAAFVALGVFAALVTVGIAIVLLAKVARPG